LLLWCLQALLFNHYPIEICFVESPLGATPQRFRFGHLTDEQILEKPVGAMNNKESSDIGHIGEIRKRKTKQKINKDK
jgi:hypothetical protein